VKSDAADIIARASEKETGEAAGNSADEEGKAAAEEAASAPFTHFSAAVKGRHPLRSAQARLFGGRRARAGKRHIRRSRRIMGRACYGAFIRLRALSEQIFFSSLTRRIVILNFAALCALLAAILYMNQFRDGLIEAKMDNLRLQGRIIAGAIAASATADTGTVYVHPLTADGSRDGHNMVETWYFPIDTHRVEMILSRVISPAVTRAVIYDRDDNMLLDSRSLYSDGRISSYSLPPIDDEHPSFFRRIYEGLHHWIFGPDSMPYIGSKNIANQVHKEVLQAMQGKIVTSQSRNVQGELIVSVAVPIQRYHAVLGVLLLSTAGSDIDNIVRAERLSIFKNFAAVAFVMLVLSLFLSAAIAIPLRRLSDAAQRVRFGTNKRVKIPDYSFRRDEIGHLSSSVSQMTDALYSRIETIGSFAADVSHELKNPLTSLRSAAETLPLAKTEEARKSLLDIINHDVRRLNRLITDISSASRLDAELAREDSSPVDLLELMNNLVRSAREVRKKRRQAVIDFTVEPPSGGQTYYVSGHELRLAQVFSNLIENARSFIPEESGRIAIYMKQANGFIIVTVEDNGPGIRAKNIERIFERFYTDRPAGESFGQNSGLGLSISRQIVEAHNGALTAENIYAAGDAEHCLGARFIVRLPALDEKKAAAAAAEAQEKPHSSHAGN